MKSLFDSFLYFVFFLPIMAVLGTFVVAGIYKICSEQTAVVIIAGLLFLILTFIVGPLCDRLAKKGYDLVLLEENATEHPRHKSRPK